MYKSDTTILLILFALFAMPAHATTIANQKLEGGILILDDYDMVAQTRFTDVHITIKSKQHNAFIGDQFEGKTYLTVNGKDYIGGKAVAEELEKLTEDKNDRVHMDSCLFDLPEPVVENNQQVNGTMELDYKYVCPNHVEGDECLKKITETGGFVAIKGATPICANGLLYTIMEADPEVGTYTIKPVNWF